MQKTIIFFLRITTIVLFTIKILSLNNIFFNEKEQPKIHNHYVSAPNCSFNCSFKYVQNEILCFSSSCVQWLSKGQSTIENQNNYTNTNAPTFNDSNTIMAFPTNSEQDTFTATSAVAVESTNATNGVAASGVIPLLLAVPMVHQPLLVLLTLQNSLLIVILPWMPMAHPQMLAASCTSNTTSIIADWKIHNSSNFWCQWCTQSLHFNNTLLADLSGIKRTLQGDINELSSIEWVKKSI